jgi:2-polyprenyl-3-methyl-5-hydroxy-6-metoxy-1,4-benzoquinol methylase
MLLSRTRARLAFAVKDRLFRWGNFQSLLEEKELRMLTQHMGFRHQWDEHRRFQMEIIQREGLKPSSHVMEIGCGPLTLGIPLMQWLDKGHYTGLDVRPAVLGVAHGQVAKAQLAGKNPRLLFSEDFGASELGEAERFEIVWSFSVLFHLTDELLEACFAQVARRLSPDGAYVANINAEMPESTWLQFPFNRRDPAFYGAIAGRHGLRMTERGTLESLGFRLDASEKRNRLLRFEHR